MAKANSTLLPAPVAARRGLLLAAVAALTPKPAPAASPATRDRVDAAADALVACLAVPVRCNAMAPALQVSDLVTVDAADRVPSPPGAFLLRDAAGALVFRNVEVVANTSPLLLRISDNASATVEPLASVNIEGRAVGVWRPTTRALAVGGGQ